MTAEIIAIGNELLGPVKVDTNSLYLARELAGLGIQVLRKSVLPDDTALLAAAIRESCARAAHVFLIGGLGPTEDDRTRSAAAAALELPLLPDAEAANRVRAWFAGCGRDMPIINLRQADRIQGADWLPNDLGTAPGQWCSLPAGALVLLPGPPVELQAMFQNQVRPRLAAAAGPRAFFTRVLGIAGLSESEVDELAAPIYRQHANPVTTILAAGPAQVELHLHAWALSPPEAQFQADSIAALIEQRLGAAVFSRERESLEAVVGSLLSVRGETVAVAESCTGGLLGARLTGPPGASRWFVGGLICYDNAIKRKLAGVEAATLEAHGAVSAPVAIEMAAGARAATAADWGVAITGIAGPDGGSAGKPVGTVFLAVSHEGSPPAVFPFRFSGDRERIRRLSAQYALNQLRLLLLLLPR